MEEQTPPKKKRFRFGWRDWILILLILGTYIVLFVFARGDRKGSEVKSGAEVAQVAPGTAPKDGTLSKAGDSPDSPSDSALELSNEESNALDRIETAAKKSSWENLENTRSEILERFSEKQLQIHPNVALYFFPETLPKDSLEADFSESELKPGLIDLKRAYQKGDSKAAYRVLKTRVENYELGASGNQTDLPEEAIRFLTIYSNFSR